MDIHNCTTCSLNFSSKSNLNKHIKKFHEINETNQPVKKKDNQLQLRVIELENELKLKNMELKMLHIEIENLKLQSIPDNHKIRNPTPPPKFPEFCLDTFLNVTCKNAYNFDDIFEDFIFNADYNSWLINVDNGQEEFQLLKYLEIFSYPKGSNFYVDFFCEPLSKIENNKKPIFCSDNKRNIYYIKNNNEWNKIHYNELINKIYRKISSKPLIAMNYIFSPTLKKINLKQFYKIYPAIKNFDIIKTEHYDKLVLNFCDTTPEAFLHKCNLALKKITGKNQEPHIASPLDAMSNELFNDEIDSELDY
jgi:hypothetical protein